MTMLMGAEILELQDQETVSLTITGWEIGEMDIVGRTFPGSKRIRVLRVRVPPASKTLGPAYWDITGQTLIEQLLPFLDRYG